MLLPLSEAAAYLGMTPSALRKLAKRGGIVFFQHGSRGRLKFKAEWLDEYIARHTRRPGSPGGRQPRRKASVAAPSSASEVLGFRPELYRR
jgi:excisionase family DNA binding protein